MPRSETARLTWPLPWWMPVVPALLTAGFTIWYITQARDWLYIAPSRLAGMPAESLMISGPALAAAAAWVSWRLAARTSPLANPVSRRASGRQALQVLGVLLGWIVPLFVLASVVGTWWIGTQVPAWSSYLIALALATTFLAFFVVGGFLTGLVLANWVAPLVALVGAAAWLLPIPMTYGLVTGPDTRGIGQLLFPAMVAMEHRPFTGPSPAVIVLLYVLVVAAIATLSYGVQRSSARLGRGPLIGSAVALGCLTLVGAWLPTVLPYPFAPASAEPVECSEFEEDLKVCLLPEQVPALADLEPELRVVLDRMDGHLPDTFTTIASYTATEAMVERGSDPEQIISFSASSWGANSIAFDMAASIAGIPQCDPRPDGAGQQELASAFAFASWLAQDARWPLGDTPLEQQLQQASDEQVLAWYTANEAAFLNCTFTGRGP